MATQTVEFHAEQGLSLTAMLFAVGSDTVVATASAVTAATNRKVIYSATFADVPAGTYELIAFDGTDAVACWYVVLAEVEGTYRAGDAGELALLILRNKQVTNPSGGLMTVYAADGTTPLLTAQLYEDAAGAVAYRGRGAERRERLA